MQLLSLHLRIILGLVLLAAAIGTIRLRFHASAFLLILVVP